MIKIHRIKCTNGLLVSWVVPQKPVQRLNTKLKVFPYASQHTTHDHTLVSNCHRERPSSSLTFVFAQGNKIKLCQSTKTLFALRGQRSSVGHFALKKERKAAAMLTSIYSALNVFVYKSAGAEEGQLVQRSDEAAAHHMKCK